KRSMHIMRFKKLIGIGLAGMALLSAEISAFAQDPLPSWNEGPAKQAIIHFVQTTTTPSSPDFVPSEERIAAFDQAGTFWVKHPIYAQVVYCLDRVPTVVKEKPELAQAEPFKTVLSGNSEAISKLSKNELMKILAATLTGVSVEDLNADVKAWIARARDPRWKR